MKNITGIGMIVVGSVFAGVLVGAHLANIKNQSNWVSAIPTVAERTPGKRAFIYYEDEVNRLVQENDKLQKKLSTRP